MKLLTLGLSMCLLVASVHGQGNIIADGIVNFLEQFRRDMPCGFPATNVPPLAPVYHAFFPVNIDLSEFAFQGNLLNFFGQDLDTFVIRNVGFSMLQMQMTFHFYFPFMRATGSFSNGYGRSPNSCGINGAGWFSMQLNDVDFHMVARMVVRDGSLEMGDMDTNIVIGSFNSNIQHFVGTVAQSETCNRYLESWMPWLFYSNQQSISNYIDTLLRPIANAGLTGMTLQNLLDMLLNPPPPGPPCNP